MNKISCKDIICKWNYKYSFIWTNNDTSFWAMAKYNKIGFPSMFFKSRNKMILFKLLHEIGHCETYKPRQIKPTREFLATQWAIKEFNKLNLRLSKRDRELWQEYIYSFTTEKNYHKYKLNWNDV